jgi:TonB family protein
MTVRATLDARGRVADARAVRDTAARGNLSAFEAAALDAVRQWIFEPPADPPLAFDIRLTFLSGSDTVVRFDQMFGFEEPRQIPAWYAATTQIRPQRTDRNRGPYSVGAPLAPGEFATVILEAEIGTNGRVLNPQAVFGNPPFREAAIKAVASWRFESARADGKEVPYTMRLTVRFEH